MRLKTVGYRLHFISIYKRTWT